MFDEALDKLIGCAMKLTPVWLFEPDKSYSRTGRTTLRGARHSIIHIVAFMEDEIAA